MTITLLHARAEEIPLDVLSGCDVQIVDPPYSPYVHAHAVSCHSAGEGPTARDFGFNALSETLMRHIAVAAASVSRWSIVFCDLESTHLWRVEMERLGVEYVREVYWPDGALDPMPQRWTRWSQPQLSGDRPPSGAEATLSFHRADGTTRAGRIVPRKKHWNGSGGITHWTAKCLRGEDKGPAEKPLDLALAIVSAYSDPEETVVDLCAGSGTIAQACRVLGRSCLAVEADETTYERARARLNAPLSDRDRDRLAMWADEIASEASRVVRVEEGAVGYAAWARAQRRLEDARRARA